MDRKQIKELAKQRLSENRVPMILVCLINTVLAALVSANSGVTYNFNAQGMGSQESMSYTQTNPVMQIISFILSVFVLNALAVGVAKFFRENRYENKETAVMLDGFKNNYGKNVITMLVCTLFIALGFIVFIIPGIIVALGLALVPYLLSTKPELGVMDTIKLSWELMKGHKADYFILGLSFFGWMILVALTLGILGIFYVNPYMAQAQAIFCDEVLKEEV